VTDSNEVFCFVFAVSLSILESEAAEGAFVSSHLVVDTGVRLDLRKIMLEDRANSIILPKKEKRMPRLQRQRQDRKFLAR
jgi:hypothetical protein